MPTVDVDGEPIDFPDDMSDQEIIAAIQGLPEKQAVPPMNPAVRTLGRLGRNVTGGLASLGDMASLIPKTAAAGGEYLLEMAGQEGTGVEKFLQKARSVPSLRETALGQIDKVTGNALQPQNTMESVTDFVNEALVPTGSFSGVKNLASMGDDALGTIAKTEAMRPAIAQKAIETVSNRGAKTAETIRAEAGRAYKTAEQKGGILKPEFTNKFLDEIEKLDKKTAMGQVMSGDSPFTQIINRMRTFRDHPITLQAAQEIDESLGDAIDDFVDKGRLKKPGKKLLDIQSTFRNMIDDADELSVLGDREGFQALKSGRKLWSKAARLGDVERIISHAERMDNPATSIRSGFRTLLNNPSRLRGFSKTEQEAIKKAAETGVVGDTLRIFGSRLTPIIAGATGGGLGGTALAHVGSMASRGAGTALQMRRASALADMIAGNQKISPVFKGSGKALGLSTYASLRAKEQLEKSQ